MTLRSLSHAVIAIALVVQLPTLLVATSAPEAALPSAESIQSAPSKLCHPKKPITCRAADLAALNEAAISQQAALCIGPKWICNRDTNTAPAVTQPESQEQAALCIGPKWICNRDTNTTPAVTQPESQEQAALCIGPKWICNRDTNS